MMRWITVALMLAGLGAPALPGSVAPGESGILMGASMLRAGSRWGTDGCTTVEIVAFGLDGDEVERAEPPLCVGDEWIVEGD